MLGLATHEPHFRVLREDVFFQESKGRTCRLCGQKGHIADECKGEAKQKSGEFDERDDAIAKKPFIWLHVSILREYLEAELHIPDQPFRFDLERALDDWVFMCFFVGNDFLPHLPSLDIRENGIDTLMAIWRDNIPLMGGYVTKDGQVDLAKCQYILDGLAKQEDAIFKRRKQTEERRDANAKRRKLEEQNRNGNGRSVNTKNSDSGRRRSSPDYGKASRPSAIPPPDLPLFAPGKGDIDKNFRAITHEMVVNRGAIYKANVANKSAAAVLKEKLLAGGTANGNSDAQESEIIPGLLEVVNDGNETPETPLSALGKRKADLLEVDESSTPGRSTPDIAHTPKADSDEPPPDNVRLWEDGYADRYYETKFGADPKDIAFRNKVAAAYVEGLAWVLAYYSQGCPSWTWFYPYHYAPFAADFVNLAEMKIVFDKSKPIKPYEQLMSVMPAGSNHTIPEPFRSLMTDEDSEIIDFYPEEFPIDLNGKKFAWQGVALLPFIDGKRLLDAMNKRYPLLTEGDHARNQMGKDILIISDRHPLYEDVAANFYSKRQGAPKYNLNVKLSEGLAGKVEKNPDYTPQSQLVFPLENVDMPSLEEDHSIRQVFSPYF
jgi:5'-3' exoribonuclease 2